MSGRISHSRSSGHPPETKLEKEKTRLIQEKCQGMLNEMLRDEDNKYCVDCDAKGPRWASWNLGIFLCIRCAGIHRNLGVHISKVKSVNLDTWTPEQVVAMTQLGNSRARAIYEANLPETTRRPQTDVALESFIRAKYEHKKYIAKEYIPTPITKPNWDAEIEELLKKKKKAAVASSQDIVLPIRQFGNKSNKQQQANNKGDGDKSNSTPTTKSDTNSSTKDQQQQSILSSTTNDNKPKTSSYDLSDDLLGLTLDSSSGSGGQTSNSSNNSSDPFASPAKNQSASNELFGLDSSDLMITNNSSKLMSKESIMSLYGGGNNGGMGMGMGGVAPVQQQQQQLGGMGLPNSLAGLNPFLVGPGVGAPTGGFPQQQQQGVQGFSGPGGFGVQQQVPPAQQFMFNNIGGGLGQLGGLGGGISSPQQQFQQFQQSTTTNSTNPMMMNQFTTYPTQQIPFQQQQQPSQQQQFIRSPLPAQNYNNNMFAQPQATPPNFLN